MCSNVHFLPPDTTLTPRTLLRALSAVRDFWGSRLLFSLGIPYPVLSQINSSSYPSEDEKKMAVLQYFLQTVPGVSWGRIAGLLWRLEEHTALEIVRQYLPHKPGGYIYTTLESCIGWLCHCQLLTHVHLCK